ncbi:MAG: response regulator transcription factor [Ktedonobacterales bacterium]
MLQFRLQGEPMTAVLLVEDAADLALVILRELEAAGYRALHAADGLAALDLHAREQPDLVILDWMLPKLDGLEVLRRLRHSAPTPVLMLTARAEETDRVLGLEVGADDYLTKPFSTRELMARVRAMLRRADLIRQTVAADRQGTGDTLTRGALQLDDGAHQALLDGLPLDLSPTEFALLHLLLRSPGRAFSRAYLLETVWRESYIGGDRSVDNVVLRLRKKLGALGDEIETVWGIGYRLRPEKRG